MFDRVIQTQKPLDGAMNTALNACNLCRLKITCHTLSEKKFRITAKEKLDIFNLGFCGALLNISGFKIEDEVLVTIIALCNISSADHEVQAKNFTNNFTDCFESML